MVARNKKIENKNENKRNNKSKDEEESDVEENDIKVGEDDEQNCMYEDVKPIGDISRVSIDGSHKISHFLAFQFDGRSFHIDDSVLVTPEEGKIKPTVVIIKDIFQTKNGDLMVKGQRMYRPEDAVKKEGGMWQSNDHRELFYSRRIDQVPANAVMHKCVIHFVPLNKPTPDRKVNPGFIVKKSYDYVQKKLRDLTERECKGLPQHKVMP